MILRGPVYTFKSFRTLFLIGLDTRQSVGTIVSYYILCNNNVVENISKLLDCFGQEFEKLPKRHTIRKHRNDRRQGVNYTPAVGV